MRIRCALQPRCRAAVTLASKSSKKQIDPGREPRRPLHVLVDLGRRFTHADEVTGETMREPLERDGGEHSLHEVQFCDGHAVVRILAAWTRLSVLTIDDAMW